MSSSNFFDFRQKVVGAGRRPSAGASSSDLATQLAGSAKPLSVAQLTQIIDKAIRAGVPSSVLVRGEVSNFKFGASGHAYFTLKDSTSCIDCAMFKSEFDRVKFRLSDGLELIASGRVGVYSQRGKYQLYVNALQPVGQGALELAFRQLHARLQGEGLFEADRKRPIPRFPHRIALVTSRDAAALQDVLKVLRRFPWLELALYHVPVQGEGAGAKIAAAIAHLGTHHSLIGGVDLILLTRGGGSLEDLWAFNEECVARAIVASPLPVVTGIGHEVDTSIADLVADYFAHTPTEAAQVITSAWRTVGQTIDTIAYRITRSIRQQLVESRQRLESVERHAMFRRPTETIDRRRQWLDDRQRALALAMARLNQSRARRLVELSQRLEEHRPAAVVSRMGERLRELQSALTAALTRRLRHKRERLFLAGSRLREHHPRHLLILGARRLDADQNRLLRASQTRLRDHASALATLAVRLQALSPHKVLQRGYTVTRHKKTNVVIRSASGLSAGDLIVTQFADGKVESRVEDATQLRLFE